MRIFIAILMALLTTFGSTSVVLPQGRPSQARQTLTVGLTANPRVLSYEDNALTYWIEEKCNVDLEFIEYAGGTDVDTQISTTIAARQELPDILFAISLNENTMRRYGKDGYFLNLNKYYEDREGASKIFWDRLENELTEEEQQDVIRSITDPNTGGIYGVPSIQTSLVDGIQYQTWINVEWLDKLGLEKPTNREEFVKVLRAFAENDCNGNGNNNDEIPLFGSANAGMGGNMLPWLINMFVYYNTNAPYIVDESGKLVRVETTDEYREALIFINDLYKEGLLTSLAFTASANEMKQITTPSSGTALCGIFVGHLTIHTVQGNEVLYQYEPLQTWGCAVRNTPSANLVNFITADCANPDKAFEVLMALWSEEGSYRIRYGEKGVHWDDPDPGATSISGLPATIKIINDPLTQQNTVLWSKASGTLLIHAEGESAQLAEQLDNWSVNRIRLHAESNRLFNQAAEKNNPEVVCPKLILTEEEEEELEMERTNVGNRISKARTEFCSGILDPNDDKAWADYLDELNSLGLPRIVSQAQMVYERQ